MGIGSRTCLTRSENIFRTSIRNVEIVFLSPYSENYNIFCIKRTSDVIWEVIETVARSQPFSTRFHPWTRAFQSNFINIFQRLQFVGWIQNYIHMCQTNRRTYRFRKSFWEWSWTRWYNKNCVYIDMSSSRYYMYSRRNLIFPLPKIM